MSKRIEEVVRYYRKNRIYGKLIDFVPFGEEEIKNVVNLRNHPKNMHFLAQEEKINYQSQIEWFEKYALKTDDIYWCIYNKKEEFVGTMRLYDIDDVKDMCTQGSFVLDDDKVDEAPYSIEAELMSLDFAFGVLKMEKVVNEDRVDNKIMNNLSKKIGFVFQNDTIVNGYDYKLYYLSQENYNIKRDNLQKIIEYWVQR